MLQPMALMPPLLLGPPLLMVVVLILLQTYCCRRWWWLCCGCGCAADGGYADITVATDVVQPVVLMSPLMRVVSRRPLLR